MNIQSEVKALPDDYVSVLNYRYRPSQWMSGTVLRVSISVGKDGSTRNMYDVYFPQKRYAITVNDEEIVLIGRPKVLEEISI